MVHGYVSLSAPRFNIFGRGSAEKNEAKF